MENAAGSRAAPARAGLGRFFPVVAILWTAFFLINFNVAMMIPLLPFIEVDVGLSPWQAGVVLAAFPVTALLSNLAIGPFIDRIGRKSVHHRRGGCLCGHVCRDGGVPRGSADRARAGRDRGVHADGRRLGVRGDRRLRSAGGAHPG